MGCGCQGSSATRTPTPTPDAEPGEWVVVYPSGRTSVVKGPRARQLAQREAIATGGKAHQV